jgi:hypothetical protein
MEWSTKTAAEMIQPIIPCTALRLSPNWTLTSNESANESAHFPLQGATIQNKTLPTRDWEKGRNCH